MKDPIVEEVRAARQAIAARFNYDSRAIAEYARRHQREWGHTVVDLSTTPEAKRARRAQVARCSTAAPGPRRTRVIAARKRPRQHA